MSSAARITVNIQERPDEKDENEVYPLVTVIRKVHRCIQKQWLKLSGSFEPWVKTLNPDGKSLVRMSLKAAFLASKDVSEQHMCISVVPDTDEEIVSGVKFLAENTLSSVYEQFYQTHCPSKPKFPHGKYYTSFQAIGRRVLVTPANQKILCKADKQGVVLSWDFWKQHLFVLSFYVSVLGVSLDQYLVVLGLLPQVSVYVSGCTVCHKKPGVDNVRLKACGRCDCVLYCSESCQRIDWSNHKSKCIKPN